MSVTFQLPAGPKNLQSLFPGVDFTQIDEYYLEIQDPQSLQVLVTTNKYNRSCCCNDDVFRVFFVNYPGAVDGINFRIITEETETVSSSWKKPLQYPLAKWDGGKQRFNVTSNETITAVNSCYGEEDQGWLKELLATPNAWLQWFGTQQQDDDYIPIVIKDSKFVTRKFEDRYVYELQIQFEMANENIILRN